MGADMSRSAGLVDNRDGPFGYSSQIQSLRIVRALVAGFTTMYASLKLTMEFVSPTEMPCVEEYCVCGKRSADIRSIYNEGG